MAKIVRNLTEEELEQVKFLKSELDDIEKNPSISEEGFKSFNNVIVQLCLLRDSYYLRLLSLAKQDELS